MKSATALNRNLAKAHIEAKFAWDKGATEAADERSAGTDSPGAMALGLRCGITRRFFPCTAGNSENVLSHGLDRAMQARLAVSKVLAKHGYTDRCSDAGHF